MLLSSSNHHGRNESTALISEDFSPGNNDNYVASGASLPFTGTDVVTGISFDPNVGSHLVEDYFHPNSGPSTCSGHHFTKDRPNSPNCDLQHSSSIPQLSIINPTPPSVDPLLHQPMDLTT